MPPSHSMQICKLQNVLEFAAANHALPDFINGLGRVVRLVEGYEAEADKQGLFVKGTIGTDFAPYSFVWSVEILDQHGVSFNPPRFPLCGGLIYFGPDRNGPKERPHQWSVHT